jgi:hypothetical protein
MSRGVPGLSSVAMSLPIICDPGRALGHVLDHAIAARTLVTIAMGMRREPTSAKRLLGTAA